MDAKANKNKMGVLPIGKLIADVSVPLMVSMLVQSLYNVIGSRFVAKISESAVTATGLAYSAQMLMLAVAVGTGVGVNSLLSRSLGKGDREFANKTATTGLLLALFWTVIFMIIGGLFSGKFIAFFTDDTQIIDYGISYLTICALSCVGIFLATTGERLFQATGNTMLSMLAQLSGAVMNIILDPILIFDFGAGLGVKGAALATVIGQITAAAVSLILISLRIKKFILFFKGFKP
ncbi:MAG: polysaccharide biosynthesis C-terminal domain-containing protein, partial [Clostridiales bacterium]|nr:polysaccharide biosynthesis C-terminal domain-containing protein [Clostridiales bacterium]